MSTSTDRTYKAVAHVAEGLLPVLVHVGFNRQRREHGKVITLAYCEATVTRHGVRKGVVMWVDTRMLTRPETPKKHTPSQRRRDSRRKAQQFQRQLPGSATAQGAQASGADTPVPTEVRHTYRPIAPREGAVFSTVTCTCGNTWEAITTETNAASCGKCKSE